MVLTGWSRGASLAVLTGGSRHAMPGLAGVIAIGLTEDENLAIAGDSDDDPAEAPARRSESSVELYPLLAEVAPKRVAVIQSTGDAYLRCGARPPVVRGGHGPPPVLRRDRKEPPLQRRHRRLRRRPQVSVGLGVRTGLTTNREPLEPVEPAPVEPPNPSNLRTDSVVLPPTQIFPHLRLPIRPVMAALRAPVVDGVADPLARQHAPTARR